MDSVIPPRESRTPNRGLFRLIIIVALGAAAWALWPRSHVPSPFYWPEELRATHSGPADLSDPVSGVFQAAVARLSQSHDDVKLIGGGGSTGSDRTHGGWSAEQHREIHCSPKVARELMLDLRAWLEFTAEWTGITLRSGGEAWDDGMLTRFSYYYEDERYKGVINCTIAPIKQNDAGERLPKDKSAALYIPTFQVQWDTRETTGRWKPTNDGDRWELREP